MGANKHIEFSKEENDIAYLLKVLGHPARIAIINFLKKEDACICKDIVEVMPLAQPTISLHLKELKTAGFVKGSIEGKNVCYCLDKEKFQEIETYIKNII